MIPSPNYSDFYKFSTSFGLFLIIASIAIYLFFVNSGYGVVEDFLINYPPEKLRQEGYSNESIIQIENFYRSKISLFSGNLLFLVPLVSLIFLMGGVFLFFYGFINWKVKQKILDKYDMYQTERAQIEYIRNIKKLKKELKLESKIKKMGGEIIS